MYCISKPPKFSITFLQMCNLMHGSHKKACQFAILHTIPIHKDIISLSVIMLKHTLMVAGHLVVVLYVVMYFTTVCGMVVVMARNLF